jgi:hypothetical protein
VWQDCDTAAEQFGYPPKDGGLATLEYIALVLLEDVRAKRKVVAPRRKSGPHENTMAFNNDWELIYDHKKEFQRASPATIRKWIADIDAVLQRGKTGAGKVISAAERQEIQAYRDRLELECARREGKKYKKPTIGEIRARVSEGFVKSGLYGSPRREDQDSTSFIRDKLKRARRARRSQKRGMK